MSSDHFGKPRSERFEEFLLSEQLAVRRDDALALTDRGDSLLESIAETLAAKRAETRREMQRKEAKPHRGKRGAHDDKLHTVASNRN